MKRLRESEERLSLATESGHAGLWSMQVETGQVWASAKLREMFSFGRQEELTCESFARVTHPEDAERVRQATRNAVQNGRGTHYRVPGSSA